MMIIETSDNRLFSVRDTGDVDLQHVWWGIEVKRAKGGFAPKAKARQTLVRKEATRLIQATNTAAT